MYVQTVIVVFVNYLVCTVNLLYYELMVFNATFNDNSVRWWRSVVLCKKTEYMEKTIDLQQVTDKFII
jgi:hypothetical protein